MVSIIIPTYNTCVYLEEMIESILKQTYKNWELIIVDDVSEDNTVEMVRGYAKNDSRIKILVRERKPKGASTCRNLGIDIANGEYIVFFDSDDLIAYYCLEQRVAFMEKEKDIDFAVFPMISFDVKPFDGYRYLFGIYKHSDDLENFLDLNLPFVVCDNIYRKDILKSRKIKWDEELPGLQDSDFNMLSLINGLKYRLAFGKIDYFWRQHTSKNNISSVIKTKKSYAFYYLFNKLTKILKEREIISNYTLNLRVMALRSMNLFLLNKQYELMIKTLQVIKNDLGLFAYLRFVIVFLIKKVFYSKFIDYIFFPEVFIHTRSIWSFRRKRKKEYLLNNYELILKSHFPKKLTKRSFFTVL